MISCSLNRDKAKAKYLANGNRYYELGDYKQARSMYAKAIKADGLFGEAYYRAGLTALKQQDWDGAARNLQIAVDQQPDNQDALTQLANLFCFAYGNMRETQPVLLKE